MSSTFYLPSDCYYTKPAFENSKCSFSCPLNHLFIVNPIIQFYNFHQMNLSRSYGKLMLLTFLYLQCLLNITIAAGKPHVDRTKQSTLKPRRINVKVLCS